MRTKANVVLVLLVALFGTVSSIGQQEALPTVKPRGEVAATDASALPAGSFFREEPSVYLAALPLRDDRSEPSLADAARNNDFPTFNALYIAAKARGERVSQFEALHELWSWSMTDRLGAFYGNDIHDRLARAYPGYASFIQDQRIVDSRGNVFYPTAETRAFLLDQALKGTTAPRVLVARNERPAAKQEIAPLTPRVTAPKSRPRLQKAALTPKRASATKQPATQVARTTKAPVSQIAKTSNVPAAEAAAAPSVTTQAPQNTVTTAAVIPPVPVPTATEPAETATQKTPQHAFLLLIIGLLGLGVLAALLRAPKEVPSSILGPPAEKPMDKNVEPIRKPAAAPQPPVAPPAAQTKPESRANGSRG